MEDPTLFGYPITQDEAAGITAKGSIMSLTMSSLLLFTGAPLVALGSLATSLWVLVGLYMFARLELGEKQLSADNE